MILFKTWASLGDALCAIVFDNLGIGLSKGFHKGPTNKCVGFWWSGDHSERKGCKKMKSRKIEKTDVVIHSLF